MNQAPRVRDVVIVGGGTAGWMAAAALAKFLGRSVSITVVESEQIGTVGVGEATIPQIKRLNAALELDENEFIKKTHGSFKLGIEFVDWLRLGHSYIHTFGQIGLPLGSLPFHHYWLRHVQAGGRDDLWDFCLNSAAARDLRFAPMERVGQTALEGIAYAYHFDAGLYAKFLRAYAEERGARRVEGRIVDTTRVAETGDIAAVVMEDDRSIAGDLFVDCSGFRGLLIEQALATGYQDWSHWLPCDRAIAVPSTTDGPFRPYTQSMARPAGWQWRIPLQHRSGNGHVFCSRFMSDDEATAILLDNLEGEPLADPRVIPFTTGRRNAFWNKNVVALGLASGFLEPLESTSIHLIQSGVSHLIAHFPLNGIDGVDRAEYNRLMGLEFAHIRDFLVLHYSATERDDTAFWTHVRTMDRPAELDRKTALFRANGRLYREQEDLFTDSSWLQVMIGQGVTPTGRHPMADGVTDEQLASFLSNVRAIVGKAAGTLPSHADYIARTCAYTPTDSTAAAE